MANVTQARSWEWEFAGLAAAGVVLANVFWFRPQTAFSSSWAIPLFLTGRRPGWGSIPRGAAFDAESETELVSAPLPR